jgi:hypothetical protein
MRTSTIPTTSHAPKPNRRNHIGRDEKDLSIPSILAPAGPRESFESGDAHQPLAEGLVLCAFRLPVRLSGVGDRDEHH